jgi:hypothetical protein
VSACFLTFVTSGVALSQEKLHGRILIKKKVFYQDISICIDGKASNGTVKLPCSTQMDKQPSANSGQFPNQ